MGASLGKTATDKLMTILSSRTIAEEVIQETWMMKSFSRTSGTGKGEWKKDKPPTLQDALLVLQEWDGKGDRRPEGYDLHNRPSTKIRI